MTEFPASDALKRFSELPDFSVFKAFADALWRKQAAVMVGAGFSRVCNREKNSPVPPLWNTFKSKMEAALGYDEGTEPDALRLAQEYQTLHGNNGMDKLIHELIADNQWEPGVLHKQLLELPWRDVLTTNWDTLLERTKLQTPDRIYNCVLTINDIAHRARPRIVKLHGSLPSHRPFIFTEDDYRTYPIHFAPFVNLVQQVMLEHDLCLIGFSGRDPNFLAWSGWVRDTLTVSARSIRLVGVLNLSPVTRALLERRNVTPIDLAPLVRKLNPDEQHEKALELFFAALLASKPDSPYKWKQNRLKTSRPHAINEQDKPTRAQVLEEWAADRRNYPGWIVCPKADITPLRYTYVVTQTATEAAEVHLRFSLEQIWRHRTARISLSQKNINEADEYYNEGQDKLTDQEKSELCANITAECRIHQKWGEWARWMSRLAAIGGDQAAYHHAYETGLRAVLNWDDDAIYRASVLLKNDEPVWMMRRAGLLTALFHHREAAELYQAALFSIRQKLLLSPKSAWLISLEGWASIFHRVSFGALNDGQFVFPDHDTEETRMRYVTAKADPWVIISDTEAEASERIDRNRRDSEPWQLSFKPGRYSPGGINRIGGDDDCPFYRLLELMDRIGGPGSIASVNLFCSRLELAYRAIKNPDENALLAFLARYKGAENKVLNWTLSRMQVACLSEATVQHFLSVIPRRIDRLINLPAEHTVHNYLKFLLALLARVTVRATSIRAFELFEWVTNLLNHPMLPWTSYSVCSDVLDASIEVMEIAQRQNAVLIALHMKLPDEANARGNERSWPEVFDSFSETDVQKINTSEQDIAQINSLISSVKLGSKLDRSRALRRLNILHKVVKLTDDQARQLGTAIWERCEESGWPADVDLYSWVFLRLPGKERAESLFIETIIGKVMSGVINHELLVNLRHGLKLIEDTIPKDNLIACIKSCLAWKPAAARSEISSHSFLFGGEQQDKVIGSEVGEVLARALLPLMDAGDLPQDVVEQLKTIDKLLHIPSMAATAFQLVRIWPDLQVTAFKHIRYALASRRPERVYSVFTAIEQAISSDVINGSFLKQIKELLLHACEQRTQPGLSYTLNLLGKMQERGHLKQGDLERISDALPYIIDEYCYDQQNLEVFSKAELPTVRRAVHRLLQVLPILSSELKTLRKKLEQDPLPEVRLLRTETDHIL